MRIIVSIIIAVVFCQVSFAAELPISEGVWVRKPAFCEELRRGELEMIDLEVTNNGRSFGLLESSCQVATVSKVREARFSVLADCREFGELYQFNFFLDVVSASQIRVEGEDHYLCRPQAVKSGNTVSVETLIERWSVSDEDCRGGSGDSPKTQKACSKRDGVVDQLSKRGWCLGTHSQSRSQYEWHECGPTSIRQ